MVDIGRPGCHTTTAYPPFVEQISNRTSWALAKCDQNTLTYLVYGPKVSGLLCPVQDGLRLNLQEYIYIYI